MASNDGLDAVRIRELLLDFYQKHDPERLAAGLDVFSMVVWTQANGLAALNDMLEHQYGARIDPRKKMGGSQQSFARFSMMMSAGSQAAQSETAMRSQLYKKLFEFYEEHDPARGAERMPDFIDYILLHGLKAFNKKLRSKYGAEITLDPGFEPPEPKDRTLPKSTRSSVAPPPPPPDDHDELDAAMVPPPPPPPPDDGAMSPEEQDRLEAQLRTFYAVHDPPKLEHIGPIMDWALAIGADQLEAKLIQIYGAGFEDVDGSDEWDDLAGGPNDDDDDDDDALGLFGSPAPPPRPPAHDSSSTGIVSKLRSSMRTAFSGASRPKPQPPVPPASARKGSFTGGHLVQGASAGTRVPAPPSSVSVAQRKASFTGGGAVPPPMQAAGKPGKPRPPKGGKAKKPSVTTGVQFEGLPKSAVQQQPDSSARKADWPPRQGRTKPAPPKSPSFTGATRSKPVKPTPPPGAAKWGFADNSGPRAAVVNARDDGEGPCSSYQLDLTGASFGMCVCGYPRMAHRQGGRAVGGGGRANGSRAPIAAGRGFAAPVAAAAPAGASRSKPQPPRQPRGYTPKKSKADVRAGGGEKGGDRACNNFRLDMLGTSYGVCECGFPRDQHNVRAQMEAADRKQNAWGNGGGGQRGKTGGGGGGFMQRVSRGFR